MVNRRMCFRRLGHFVAGVLGIFYFGVDTAKQSGQPIKVWCAEHGVPVSSFYKWQRKMRDSLLAEEKAEIQFQELEVPQNICGTATSDRIHLHIQDILVELPAGASPEQISAVIRGIRHAG